MRGSEQLQNNKELTCMLPRRWVLFIHINYSSPHSQNRIYDAAFCSCGYFAILISPNILMNAGIQRILGNIIWLWIVTLSLYTSGSIAASQGLNFFSGYQVEVAGDGVLQSRCSYAVLKSILEILAIQHTADHAACEGVAAAYTVNDGMDAVLFGVIELLGISGVDAGRPTVIGSGMAYTQRGYTVLEVDLSTICSKMDL